MLLDITTWFSSMEMFEKVYWIFAIISSLIFLIILVMTFIAGDIESDFDGDVDAQIEGDSGPGFQFFTLKNLIGFFTIFAWSGLACIDSELSKTTTLIVSVICGLLMMIMMAAIFYFMSKLSDSGTMKMKNAINRLGEVYLPIPARRGGSGIVQVNVQGSIRELKAMTDSEEELSFGTVIKVLDVLDEHILLVEKTNS